MPALSKVLPQKMPATVYVHLLVIYLLLQLQNSIWITVLLVSREISFEDIEDEDIFTRAWDELLNNRVLIYCL